MTPATARINLIVGRDIFDRVQEIRHVVIGAGSTTQISIVGLRIGCFGDANVISTCKRRYSHSNYDDYYFLKCHLFTLKNQSEAIRLVARLGFQRTFILVP